MSFKLRPRKTILIAFILIFSLALILPLMSIRKTNQLTRPEDFVAGDPLAFLIETDAPLKRIQKLLEDSHEKYTHEILNAPWKMGLPDSSWKTTYLERAVDKKRSDVVRLLLEAGCNPDLRIDGNSPVIISAIRNHDVETLRALMEHGATMENAEPKQNSLLFDEILEDQTQDRWLMTRAKYESRRFVNPPLLQIMQILVELEPSESEREYLQQVLDVMQNEKEKMSAVP